MHLQLQLLWLRLQMRRPWLFASLLLSSMRTRCTLAIKRPLLPAASGRKVAGGAQDHFRSGWHFCCFKRHSPGKAGRN